ncbi:MAG: antibiotic biosynthesis monooxygenase [Gammaproteobacteria bacterium]|nr:antibiotic biosynthesis monooxygenase [Gammaproteobacteria bacterium]MDH5731813.1 antibiotic biosynthesis monooxygenase [Gammaproteobacteria bacterium]
MQATVAVFGILRFPAENIEHIRPHIQSLVDTTKQNDNCIAYEVAEDLFDPGLIRFSELWPNRESLEKHLAAPHIEPWRVIAKTFGLKQREFTAYDINGSFTV